MAPAVESTPQFKQIEETIYNWLSMTPHEELQAFIAPDMSIDDTDYSKILESIETSVLAAWWSTIELLLNPTP